MTTGGDHRAVSVLYCTGNDGKFKEASHVVEAYNARCAARGSRFRATLTQVDPDPVEIQGDAADVARAKVTAALAALPPEALEGEDYVVTEDVGLSLRCLNGFPGPYCKPMLEAIGDRGLWDLASRYDDRAATVTCTLAAIRVRGGEEARDASPRLHVGVIEGAILGPPRGDVKHGKASWNSVFTPEGREKTFGELAFAEQAEFSHRKEALVKFLDAAAEEFPQEEDANR